MATEVTTLSSVYEYGGSLASLNDTLVVSSFGSQTSGELVVEDDDGEFDFDVGETATWDENSDGGAAAASYVGGGTATVGIDLGILGSVNLGSTVDVNVFESGGSSWFYYPGDQPSSLLDGLVTEIVDTVGLGPLSVLGITSVAELTTYVEQNALLTVDLSATSTMAVCYAPGTAILTPEGEVAVETLRIGDLVTTADGRNVPVRWIGHQVIEKLFADAHIQPVRIRQDSFAPGKPHRDLVLTANHGVIVDDLVIDAGALVNGTTVSHVPKSELPSTVTYYHIETSDHDVILAEGLETETFIDYVGRKAFVNYDEYVALYGHEEVIAEMPKSRISARRLVPESIRARLAARGDALDRVA
jgi:hypothetical protein